MLFLVMTTIIAHVPEGSKIKLKKFIEELGGEIVSKKDFMKLSVLNELEDALLESKQIKEGKKTGFSLKDVISGK